MTNHLKLVYGVKPENGVQERVWIRKTMALKLPASAFLKILSASHGSLNAQVKASLQTWFSFVLVCSSSELAIKILCPTYLQKFFLISDWIAHRRVLGG